ncbi:hypothetical protein [Photobacterium carnosum]|uniref:hypothetical protein n=1 Tax=Photobacterium carnosum TaxID=2023717 RepID=UPI001E425853|nr:hypothetical protein [Photobacterium carnosum]MCD9515537.1 hypothetical protein [Photobacterium carnosum]
MRDFSIQHYGVSEVMIYVDMALLNNKLILAYSIFINQADLLYISAVSLIVITTIENKYTTA